MAAESSRPVLTVEELTLAYAKNGGGVSNISFAVDPGEFLVIAGSNGSGKTTLLRLLMGLLTPQSGSIRLKGRDIFEDIFRTRKTMGLVFQDTDTQILGETVYSEIAFGPENLGQSPETIQKTVGQVMEALSLDAYGDRHPATLSGGEKRRLTIAGILAMAPEVILFDEPFANLDYPSACSLAAIIRQLKTSGKTIVMATHDLDHVLPLAHRIMVMEKGRIRALGKVSEIAPRLGDMGLRPWCPACRPLEDEL